ncbi:hypothetical protein Ancab_002207 [Ancistrocladus abbreviatus]
MPLRWTRDYDEGSDKCAFLRVTHPGATLGQTPLAAGFWWDPGRQCRCDRAHFPSFPLRFRPSSRVEISSEKPLRGTRDYDEGSDKCVFLRVTHPGATLRQTPLAAGFWWDPGRQCRCDRSHFPSYPLRSLPSSRVKISSEKQLRGTQDYDEGSDKWAFVRVTHPGATLGQTRLAAGFWWDPGRQYRCDRAHFPSFPLRSRPSSRVEM